METKREYPTSKAVAYFAVAFVVAYALQFIGICIYPKNQMLYTLVIAVSMFAPTLAVLISHKGLSNAKTSINWKLNFKQNWKWFIAAMFTPAIFTALGAALYFVIFPDNFDPNMGFVAAMIPEGADSQGITPSLLTAVSLIQSLTYAPIMNMFFAVGEEIGWRGYMTPMLTSKIGRKPALIVGGIIWGVWHWPLIICIGYNYGTGYPGAPWTGMLAMCVMTTIFGIMLSYIYDKSNCIWIPALAHGAVNAVASMPLCFTDGSITGYLLGPTLTGFVTLIPLAIVAAIVFFKHKGEKDTLVM